MKTIRGTIFAALLSLPIWAALFIGIRAWMHYGHQNVTVEAATSYNPKSGDPCAINLRVSVPITLTASGQLVTGSAGKQTYVCGVFIVNAAAQNIALVEGTGAVCATNTVGMAGGNTAATGWNLGVNQTMGFFNPGTWSVVTATTGDNICLLLSGTTQVSGFLQYVQY